MKLIYFIVLIYYIVCYVTSQAINSTSSTWFDATKYCTQRNKSLIKLAHETVFPQFKRDHADVLRKTGMWVGNYIYFRYINGTDIKTTIDPSNDKCISAMFSAISDSSKYAYVLIPRSCTDQLQPVCSRNQSVSIVEQTSSDWFKAVEICALWSPGSIVQQLETKGELAKGIITSNVNIVDETYYWTNLVKKIYLPDDGYTLPLADLYLGCGYVDKFEPKVQYGDCCQEMAVYCDNNNDKNDRDRDKNVLYDKSTLRNDISRNNAVFCVNSTVFCDRDNIYGCTVPFMPNVRDASSAVYIGVSVGGFISLIAFIVAATIIYKRRNCCKVDSFNKRTQTCGNSDISKESRYVNVNNINIEINEAHPDGPREFNDNAHRIEYASDCYSGKDYESLSSAEDRVYYPLHGQMVNNEQISDNMLTVGCGFKENYQTKKVYKDKRYENIEIQTL